MDVNGGQCSLDTNILILCSAESFVKKWKLLNYNKQIFILGELCFLQTEAYCNANKLPIFYHLSYYLCLPVQSKLNINKNKKYITDIVW